MGDKQTTNRAANRKETEGDRATVEHAAAVPNSESSTERGYRNADGDNAGGITNRPLDEEVENQNALPDRGLSQADERVRNNEDMEQ
jgi:hypothetical protein